MVTTRSAARASLASPLPGKQENGTSPGSEGLNGEAKDPVQQMLTWADTHGAGRSGGGGAWGIKGVAGQAIAYGGTVALMLGCPAFAIYMCVPKTPCLVSVPINLSY